MDPSVRHTHTHTHTHPTSCNIQEYDILDTKTTVIKTTSCLSCSTGVEDGALPELYFEWSMMNPISILVSQRRCLPWKPQVEGGFPQESRICKGRCFHLSTKWLLEIPFVQLIYQVDMQYASCSRGSRKSPSWIRLDGPSMTPTWGNVVTGHLAEPGVLRCVPLAWHGLHLAFEKQNKKPTTQVASFQIPVRMSFSFFWGCLNDDKQLRWSSNWFKLIYRNGVIFCDLELLVVAPFGSI